jgi:alpha-tubulin suppressor-like RCC1 family protein
MRLYVSRRCARTILLCLAIALALCSGGAQAPTVTQIAASWHILVLLSDGTVSAMGENRFGQLGRPKSAPLRCQPAARVDLPGKVVQVAAGDENASYALLEEGTVWAWGFGASHNLGCGSPARHTPQQVPGLTGVARVVASGASVMAVMQDGSVRAWGRGAAALHRRYAHASGRPLADQD